MVKVVFEINIARDIDYVFKNIYKKEVYEVWCKAFYPVVAYEGEIIKGGKVRFLDAEKNAMEGIVSDLIDNEYLEFSFMSETTNGVEVALKDPFVESYKFFSIDENNTHIIITLNTPNYFENETKSMWAKASIDLKNILEEH